MDSFSFSSCLRAVGWLMLPGLVLVAGCVGSRSAEELSPDQRFGHRYEDDAPDGRRTISIAAPDSAVNYFFYPATFDTVHVRPSPFAEDRPAEGQDVAVEVLVKGAFPDGCMELHAITQERNGHLINATLEMRRPQGSICANVRRPYRFYVMLMGRFGIGHYTLKLNDKAVPFQVRPPSESSR
ncbi:MAG: hypothetical protein ACE5G0_20060 [Rhodothermales bacterium]